MKIRIAMTLDIDPDAWREEILVDPDASASEVRRDVKSWVSAELGFALGDRGVLAQPGADVEIRRQTPYASRSTPWWAEGDREIGPTMPEHSIPGHEKSDVSGSSNDVWFWSCSCGRASKPGSRMSYNQARAALARHLRSARANAESRRQP